VVSLVVLLLVGTGRSEPPTCALHHEISARRLFEGDRLTVSLTLNAHSPLAQIEVYEPLPVSAELSAGSNRSVLSLGTHETARWSYELRCPERAEFSPGTLYLRIWDPSGFRVLETVHRDPKPVRVYPRIEPLHRLPRPLRTQTFVGNYVARTHGEGIEPAEIRPFTPGDQVRHVNWRASLRLGKLYVTRQHEERNADVILMLDTTSEVGLAPGSSLDHCVRVAASLAWAYLSRKDRVGLIKYGGLLHWVKPGSGRVQFEQLLDTLLESEVVFTYVAKDLALVPPGVLSPRSLVIALSPLLDSRFIKAATDLAARGFDVVILCVSPVDITRACQDASILVDVACRLWELQRRDQLAELRRQGLRVLEWHPGDPLDLVLGQLGRHRRLPRVAA
jgi:uncharacterized protein (DUF58 family)